MASRSNVEKQEAHWIEWATGCVSALLVACMIGAIFWDAVKGDASPPDLSVQEVGRVPTASGYRVAFTVSNSGAATAADVTVRGEIIDGGRSVEAVDVLFDYVPGRSSASGGVLFSHDLRNKELRIRPVSYTEP